MTQLNDILLQIQQLVLSDMREENNILGNNMNTSQTNVTLAAGQTLGSIRANSVIQIGYEPMLVTTSSSPSNITVIRKWFDGTAFSHTAGQVINVNPRFTVSEIVQCINDELDDYSAPTNGLYQMKEVTLTYIPVVQGYDMTGLTDAQVLEVWEVRAHEYGPANKWPIIPQQYVKLQRNADTSIFPSGMALTLDAPGYPGRPLRVQYKAPFTSTLALPTDNVQTVTGLPATCNDILKFGVPARLMQFRELKRSFSEAQGEPRRAQEVPVGASLTAAKGLLQYRQMRIDAERERLNKRYPRQNR